jgi:hypothetical protein
MRKMVSRAMRKLPWYAVIVFYFPAIVVVLGGATLFSATHRRIFGYPVDTGAPSGRFAEAIWMPTMVSIMLLAASVAAVQTLLLLWWIGRRLIP